MYVLLAKRHGWTKSQVDEQDAAFIDQILIEMDAERDQHAADAKNKAREAEARKALG